MDELERLCAFLRKKGPVVDDTVTGAYRRIGNGLGGLSLGQVIDLMARARACGRVTTGRQSGTFVVRIPAKNASASSTSGQVASGEPPAAFHPPLKLMPDPEGYHPPTKAMEPAPQLVSALLRHMMGLSDDSYHRLTGTTDAQFARIMGATPARARNAVRAMAADGLVGDTVLDGERLTWLRQPGVDAYRGQAA